MDSKLLALLLLLAVVFGCTSSTTTNSAAPNAQDMPASSSSGSGILNLQLTDAPSSLNLDRMLVTISSVQAHIAGSGEEEGWKTIIAEPKAFDLIAIKNLRAFLGESELAAGKYTQLRLNIDKATATIDGVNVDLTIPSKIVKLVHGFEIVEGKTTKLVLDFDAQESVSESAMGKYLMQPTIKVYQE